MKNKNHTLFSNPWLPTVDSVEKKLSSVLVKQPLSSAELISAWLERFARPDGLISSWARDNVALRAVLKRRFN